MTCVHMMNQQAWDGRKTQMFGRPEENSLFLPKDPQKQLKENKEKVIIKPIIISLSCIFLQTPTERLGHQTTRWRIGMFGQNQRQVLRYIFLTLHSDLVAAHYGITGQFLKNKKSTFFYFCIQSSGGLFSKQGTFQKLAKMCDATSLITGEHLNKQQL